MSPAGLIRGILSYALPAIPFPAVIAYINLAIGFDGYAFREMAIYYLIGLVWLAASVGLWRAVRSRWPVSNSAFGLVAIAASALAVAGLFAWNWSNQTTDFQSGPLDGLLMTLAAGGIGLVGATIHAVIAQIPFRPGRG